MCKSEGRSGFNYTTRAYRQASAHPGLWDYVGDVVRGVQCYFRIRNVRRELQRLPDHTLKDIGIRRTEIRFLPPGIFHQSFGTRRLPE